MTPSNVRKLLSIGFLILASSDCGPPISPALVGRDAIPTPHSAYLYGKFAVVNDASFAMIGTPSAVAFGLLIACKDGRDYTLWFVDEKPLLMFEIVPSSCSLRYLVYHLTSNDVRRKPVLASSLDNVEFQAGKAYYLGSFTMKTYRTGHLVDFEPVDSKDQYGWTTQVMREKFPHFAGIPTEKTLIDTPLLRIGDVE